MGHRNAVALRQRKHQLRLQRAFDVHVKLRLRHQPQQRRQSIASDWSYFHHKQFSSRGCKEEGR
jgi:hypothetical protein